MATNFPTLSPLSLRDLADDVHTSAQLLAQALDRTPELLAGTFATNHRRSIRQARLILEQKLERLVLDSKTHGRHVEMMVAMVEANIQAGRGTLSMILESAKKVAG